MHTKGTEVKSTKDKRVAQGDATRTALVGAARKLFGESGYGDTSTDEIVAAAGVTKGALYHHFGGKEDLFKAVVEQVQHEVSDHAVAEFLAPDSWHALVSGCTLWIDAHLDPAVRRIVLQDARAVLAWEDVRSIENRFGAVALRGALRKAVHAGVIAPSQPLRPLALLLLGALSEACLYIADADDPDAARKECLDLITDMLGAFRAPAIDPK
jgi:AcrR family transcriptional regulator